MEEFDKVVEGFDPAAVVYRTASGAQVVGDSRDLLRRVPDQSVDLVMTSPPFALIRQKAYGNEDQSEYVKWLTEFGEMILRVLTPSGSLVLDLGGAYQRGVPTRSLYNYRVLIEFVDTLGYHLAQEFFWYNPAKLPSPAEWVNRRKIRVTDAVNTIWWLSKAPFPKADNRKVLVPYSDAMLKLIEDPEGYYKPGDRPSEHNISKSFGRDNGGAIPKNLLQISNTRSNTFYQRMCRSLDEKSHPARFPGELPRFFIKMLTDPGDTVLDIFSGSNTTGYEAERLGRQWLAFEIDAEYAALSSLRFMEGSEVAHATDLYKQVRRGECPMLKPAYASEEPSKSDRETT